MASGGRHRRPPPSLRPFSIDLRGWTATMAALISFSPDRPTMAANISLSPKRPTMAALIPLSPERPTMAALIFLCPERPTSLRAGA